MAVMQVYLYNTIVLFVQLHVKGDRRYLKAAQKMIHWYNKQKSVVSFSAGDYVSVRIPRIDHASSDLSCLPGIVADVVGKNWNLYRIRLDGMSTWLKMKEKYMPSPGMNMVFYALAIQQMSFRNTKDQYLFQQRDGNQLLYFPWERLQDFKLHGTSLYLMHANVQQVARLRSVDALSKSLIAVPIAIKKSYVPMQWMMPGTVIKMYLCIIMDEYIII